MTITSQQLPTQFLPKFKVRFLEPTIATARPRAAETKETTQTTTTTMTKQTFLGCDSIEINLS